MTIWEEKEEYTIDDSGFSETEKKILHAVRLWMSDRSIWDNILVIPIRGNGWEQIQAEFIRKTEIGEGPGAGDSAWIKTEVYCAEILLKGLKRSRGDEFRLCLAYLFLRELLVVSNRDPYSYYEKAVEIYKVLRKYMEEKMDIFFRGRDGLQDEGLPEGYGIHCLCDVILQEDERMIEKICCLCKLYWKAFFGKYALLEYKLSEFTEKFYPWRKEEHSAKWPGYIVKNNQISIFTGFQAGMPVYTPVIEKVLEKKYGRKRAASGVGVYLDGNTFHVSDENLVLFKSEGDVKRVRIGKCGYVTDADQIYHAEQEITRDEFKRVYYRFSYTKLSQIYDLPESELRKMVKRYGLPNRIEIAKLSEEEVEQL